MTQKQAVLDYLSSHDGLTQLEAFILIGCCRLSERIAELQRDGISINHNWVEVPARNGKTAHVMRYSLNTQFAVG